MIDDMDEIWKYKREYYNKRLTVSIPILIFIVVVTAIVLGVADLSEPINVSLEVLCLIWIAIVAYFYIRYDRCEMQYLHRLNQRLDVLVEQVENSCDDYRRVMREGAGSDDPVVVGGANDRYDDTSEIDELIVQMHQRGVFQKVDEGYIGYVPELPGANTQGITLEEARANLFEAIEMTLEASNQTARENEGDES